MIARSPSFESFELCFGRKRCQNLQKCKQSKHQNACQAQKFNLNLNNVIKHLFENKNKTKHEREFLIDRILYGIYSFKYVLLYNSLKFTACNLFVC